MSDLEQWQLVPESERGDQEDYPSDEQMRHDIAGWQQEYAAWQRNELPLYATFYRRW